MVKKIATLTILFSLFVGVQAAELPREVIALLSDLKQPPLTAKQIDGIKEWEKRANDELSEVGQLDFFITSKSVINSFFIQLAKDNAQLRYKGSLQEAEKYLKTIDTAEASELTKWLIKSLTSELQSFLSSKEYENRDKVSISPASKAKLNTISTLCALLKQSGVEAFSGKIRPRLFKLAEEIFNYSQYFLFFTHQPPETKKLGKVFTLPEKAKDSVNLEQLLAPALKTGEKAAQTTSDEWIPKESDLPTPVNDWDNDNEFTIRYVVPGYNPPEELPTPVNDWDEVVDQEWDKAQTVTPEAPASSKKVDPEDDWILR